MVLFCRIFLLLSFVSLLHATRWPCIKTYTHSFLSKKKATIFSRKRLQALQSQESVNVLFPQNDYFQHCYPHDLLENVYATARKQCSLKVRVLLAECDATTSTCWHFCSDKGFVVKALDDDGAKKRIKVAEFKLTIKKGTLFYNGKRLKHAVCLQPLSGYGSFNGTAYDGDFRIIPYNNSFLCINSVGLEDYITSVLKTESWPGWPLEVNKAFAIACRSYGAYQVLQAQRSKKPYHVKNSNAHQTYRGRHTTMILKDAVEQTRGTVLGFKGAPILAMFDSCCGGIIPAHIEDFDFHKVPYLARVYACTHCKESSLYAWQVAYEHTQFESFLQPYKHEFARLHDVHITKKDKAGLVTELKLKGQKKSVAISGKQLYSLLKEVKSFYFDVHKKSGSIIVTGRGFGHHIGLCKWGARQMVRDGWDYKSILHFYYPGTHFMRLL